MLWSQFSDSLTLSAAETMYPSKLSCFENRSAELSCVGSHYFGFVLEGEAIISSPNRPNCTIGRGMYFSCPSPAHVAANGKLVVWERLGYRGLYLVGGPVEQNGRLAYIDNCSTTMIAPPPRVLDPVLNFLRFPPSVKQTMHIHPTIRLGLVVAGQGQCIRPAEEPIALSPGVVFLLGEHSPHCFHSSEAGLSLIAYHPDSETGPTDLDHPMLNRTYTLRSHGK